MGTILSTGILQSIVNGAVQSTGLFNKAGKTGATSGSVSAAAAQAPDNSQLSPFAQLIGALQQLQQSNPNQYQQVTQKIASNLVNAAQSAQAAGNSTAANQFTELATDFSTASQSGQLPGLQGLFSNHLSQAAATGSSSGSANPAVNQLFSRFQTAETAGGALNPTAIILNTLSSAGITG
jgi:hypothetical protein